ncbi:MAG: hypothetical protein ACLR4Z_01155 [Butyricicoccaceae bacterium]
MKHKEKIEYSTAYANGYNWGANLQNSISEKLGLDLPDDPATGLLSNIADNTAQIADDVSVSSDDIKLLRDIAGAAGHQQVHHRRDQGGNGQPQQHLERDGSGRRSQSAGSQGHRGACHQCGGSAYLNMYEFYMDGVRLPVTPVALTIKISESEQDHQPHQRGSGERPENAGTVENQLFGAPAEQGIPVCLLSGTAISRRSIT